MDIKYITTSAEYSAVLKHGTRIMAKGMVVIHSANHAECKIGIIASKKIGSAVKRNRCKRRLRALVNKLAPKYAQEKHWYVIIARTSILTRPFDKLTADLIYCFSNTTKYKSLPHSSNREFRV
jgi:ribonuclease P protein component